MPRLLLPPILLLAITNCATQPAPFRPTERVESESPTGEPESVYDVVVGDQRYGEAKVWSAGVYEADVEGAPRTLVHVAIEIENTSGAELALDPRSIRLESIDVLGTVLPDASLVSTTGSLETAPQSSGRLDAYFELPTGTEPRHVDGYDVRWTVSAPDGAYSQVTPFTEDEVDRPDYLPYGYFYPYYPYGYYYNLSYAYPYRRYDVVVRHHVPHRLVLRERDLILPRSLPHRAITPHHDVRPRPLPHHVRHRSVAPERPTARAESRDRRIERRDVRREDRKVPRNPDPRRGPTRPPRGGS